MKKIFSKIARFFCRNRAVLNVATRAVGAVNPFAGLLVRRIVERVFEAEDKFGAGTGATKKRYVMQVVKQDLPLVLAGIEKITQREIGDEVLLARGISKTIDGVVDILNATGVFPHK